MWPASHTQRTRGRALAPLALTSIALALVLAGCGASTTAAGTGGGGTEATATATSAPAPTATTAPAPTQTPTANPKIAIMSSGGGAYSSFGFSPDTITIKVGATVVWTNETVAPHTVTSDQGAPASFDSGMISANGGTFKHTFSTAGTYTYHCSIHPYMTATIIVIAG